MVKLFDKGICPIGIDVGLHAVRLLQFRQTSAGLSLASACRIELDSLGTAAQGAARAAEAVRHALANGDFAGRRAVLSLPAAAVHARSVRLPQMPDSDLHQALQWEAKDRFGFEVGAGSGGEGTPGELAWYRVGEVRRGTEMKDEILLFGVEGNLLAGYVQALVGLGLKLAAVDLAPCAIFRAIRRAGTRPEGETSAMLDLGHAGAQFFITRGEDLVFYKHIDIGGKKIDDAVATKLGITPQEALQMRARLIAGETAEEAGPLVQALRDAMRPPLEELARELDMCMRYYVVTFRGARPEMISLTGRQACCAQVRDALAGSLGLQVEEAQALRGVQNLGGAARPDRSGEWAVAAGLSLYPTEAQQRLEAAA